MFITARWYWLIGLIRDSRLIESRVHPERRIVKLVLTTPEGKEIEVPEGSNLQIWFK
jgi:hypothetical protein